MTTVEGKLAVMGGAAKDNGGDTEYLDVSITVQQLFTKLTK
jgi:hypothetical protein